MDVNATILVQIVNFLIAYVIIRHLLLKPAVTVILQEEEHQASLDKKLRALEATNKSKEEKLSSEWATCQQEFKKHAPAVLESQQKTAIESPENLKEAPVLDQKTVKPITNDVAQELTERLSHVR